MKLRVLSMFSGCGGLDLGFLGGFEYRCYHFPKNNTQLVYAIDHDPDAVSVFNANAQKFFGSHCCVEEDVADVPNEDIPEFDILLAGFPCQPFSNAGNREGVNDKRGRGTLFEQCARFLKASKSKSRGQRPYAFVLENVRGILSSKMEDGTTVPEEIRRRMKRLGYETRYQLINASHYGVPQNRYRVLMIGIRNDLPAFDFTSLAEVVEESGLPSAPVDPYELCLGSVLCDIPENASHLTDVWQYSPGGQSMVEKIGLCADGIEALEKFRHKLPLEKISPTISQGRSWKNIPVPQMPLRFQKIWNAPEVYRAPNFYRRFALGEICGTITASGQPENSGITHPFEHRRFSVREIARIQSFPDDFIFPTKSNHGSAYKVIGNAVPPILGWVVAKALLKHLRRNLK